MPGSLPAGLTHPDLTSDEVSVSYTPRHMFAWVAGDAYVSVLQVSSHRIIDWVPAPPAEHWLRPGAMTEIARAWDTARRAERRTA